MENDKNALLAQAQSIEQGLHSQTAQRAALQQQLSEAENALNEVSSTKEVYRIIGNIMVRSSSEKLKVELSERKDSLSARVQAIERQEKRLREQLETLQKEIMK